MAKIGKSETTNSSAHLEVLAKVFDRLAEEEPDPKFKALRRLEAEKLRELARQAPPLS
jgi:hypothetical protein